MTMTGAERQKKYLLRKSGILPPKKKAMTQLERNRKYLYGITPEDFGFFLGKQENKCAICGTQHDNNYRWCVDHDHKTGAVRGVLCTKCNTALGFIETIDINKFLEYLNG